MELCFLAVLYRGIPPPLAVGSQEPQVRVKIGVPLFSGWMLSNGSKLTAISLPSLTPSPVLGPLSYLLPSEVIFGVQFGFSRGKVSCSARR